MKRYRELYDRDQIAFVTFHQSYGYEEFVEGIAPDLQSDEIKYKLRDGAFKRLALLALSEGVKKVDDFDSRWMTLSAKAGDTGFNVQSKERKDYILTFDGMRFALSGNTEYPSIARDKLRKLWDQFKDRDLKELTSKDFAEHVQNFTPFWTVLNAMKELPEADVRLFSEPGQLPLTELLELAKESLAQPEALDFSNARRYVLVIDEINRGNISKILGELMTLLEPSKRLGDVQAMIVTLPSGEKFAVPPNLYVIGTMNTADRSIALMDVALRRRFRFEEMMPNVSVIVRSLLIHFEENYRDLSEENLLFVNVCVAVFEKVNQRIRFLYDADHQIGHSYFLKVKTLNDLQFVFLNEVIPLLQEYFYGAWRKIALTLANPYDDKGLPRRKDLPAKHHVISCTKLEEKSVLLVDDEDYEDQYEFAVSNEFMRDYPKDDSDLLSFFAGVAGVRIEELKKLDERFKEIEVMLDSTSEVEVSGEENDEIQRTRLAMEVNGKTYEEPYVPRFFEAVLSDVFQHASPPLPYRRSSRHFVSRDGLHPDGKAAIRPIPIQTPNGIVIVEGNYGRKDALRRLRELLTDMGISHRDPV
ncbi:hypothetical protein FRD01_22570 [Microvenator marinus]|uniref:ATPase dynein-related AAA domain-containing protein n=2 Tax=Microvenator marinus TaxID=2600177 RepID=A0A5B8XZJ6_9DELT|nr:hypothetical protein FRD01_22570 [Microvenator marinus]